MPTTTRAHLGGALDWVAAVLLATVAALYPVALWLQMGNGAVTAYAPRGGYLPLMAGLIAVATAGGVVALRQPGNAVGWLLLAGGACTAVALAAQGWAVHAFLVRPDQPLGSAAAWMASWSLVPGLGLPLLAIARFPSGMASRRVARAEPVAVVALAALALGQAVDPAGLDGVTRGWHVPNPMGLARLEGTVELVTGLAIAVLAPFAALVVIDCVARTWQASDPRHRPAWPMAAAVAVLPLTLAVVAVERIVGVAGATRATVAVGLSVCLLGGSGAIAIAIVRHHHFALERALDRALVHVVLSGLVGGVFVALVMGIGAAFSASPAVIPSLCAAAGAAVLLVPLRQHVQRRVNWAVYGGRSDPYAVVQGLVDRLDATADPQGVARTIVDTVGHGLRLAYVAVELDGAVVAQHGEAVTGAQRVPLSHQGEPLGAVLVAATAARPFLHQRDRHLVEELTRHAGPALHAAALTGALRQSRARAVAAREEERVRLRRELHDGLGPALAGISLQLDGVVYQLPQDHPLRPALDRLRHDVGSTVVEIRRIVQGLRPPALDQLGLLGALRERALSFQGELAVVVVLPEALPALPPAVEVAAYRIASEALANAARHAYATSCRFEVRCPGDLLEVVVTDDGRGLTWPPPGSDRGLGLRSMRERAEEAGGSMEVGAASPRGTTVRARFVLPPRSWPLGPASAPPQLDP